MGVRNGKFYGTEVAINLWKPYVQIPKEFSLAQTLVVSGNGSSLNTIEAGWQVWFPLDYILFAFMQNT